jgi:hypothetical protein
MPNYLYKRRGGPLVKWTGVAPPQARAADAVALGDCQCSDKNKIPNTGPEIVNPLSNYVAVSGDDKSIVTQASDAIYSSTGRKVIAAASAFHGYRRNQSVLWSLVWFGLGYASPLITPVVAVAQGFGKKKGG